MDLGGWYLIPIPPHIAIHLLIFDLGYVATFPLLHLEWEGGRPQSPPISDPIDSKAVKLVLQANSWYNTNIFPGKPCERYFNQICPGRKWLG